MKDIFLENFSHRMSWQEVRVGRHFGRLMQQHDFNTITVERWFKNEEWKEVNKWNEVCGMKWWLENENKVWILN